MKNSMITDFFKIIIAVFVLYNGIDLLNSVADQSQTAPVLNTVMGIIFILIGVGFLAFYIKKKLFGRREQ